MWDVKRLAVKEIEHFSFGENITLIFSQILTFSHLHFKWENKS